MHNEKQEFPEFIALRRFYSNWNANPYSKIFNLHYTVERLKYEERKERDLLYKVHIQNV
jgi:hypothetical protein